MSPPEQVYLPFWVVSATVHATIEQAQVVKPRKKKRLLLVFNDINRVDV